MSIQDSVQQKFATFRANHESVNALAQTDEDFASICLESINQLQEAVQLLLSVETSLASMFGFSADEADLQKLDENFDYIWGRFAAAEKSILDGKRDKDALDEYLAGLHELHTRFFEIFGSEDGEEESDDIFGNLFSQMGDMFN